jgi:hypothetical protein
MDTSCKNHADKVAIVRGMCQACYMRERRLKQRQEYQRQYDANVGAQVKGVTTAARNALSAGAGVMLLLPNWSSELNAKFRAKVDASGGKDACHIWTGTRNKAGYGMISLGGYTVLAHRMAHALATGDVATAVVMHSCDNPSCVNPAHLRSGTHMENMADMRAKGRTGKRSADHLRDRSNHPCAKPVQTPNGNFPSAALAAAVLGLHPRAVSRYCQIGQPGWRYV